MMLAVGLSYVAFIILRYVPSGFPGGSMVKNQPARAVDIGDTDLIPRLGRSNGGGYGNTLWYSCLENSMNRAVW